MDKIEFLGALSVEVTRRCNMHCAHCLRGEAENENLMPGLVDKLLDYTQVISDLTITGGEPSIALDQIDEVIDSLKHHDVPLYSFYCVTNGKENTLPFTQRMLELYAHCMEYGGEPECSGVALSKDRFHEEIPPINEQLLRGLTVFREDKMHFEKQQIIIPMGRAANLPTDGIRLLPAETCIGRMHGINITHEPVYVRTDDNGNRIITVDSNIGLTVNGDLIGEVDYAYDDMDDLIIGNVNDMPKVIRNLIEIAESSQKKEAS